MKAAISLLKKTYNNWSSHNAPRLGASVAFYSLLSFAPLLVLTVAVIALAFDRQSAQNGLVDQARQMIGDRGAETVKSLLANADKPSSGIFASIIAFVTLLFGASGVFGELRDALNIIWDAEPKDASGFMGMVKQRLFSFGMVLSVGFLLLVSLVISAGLAVLGKFFNGLLPLPAFVFETVNFVVSFAVITLLFALLFKYVPARHIQWRDIWVGAVVTALLFTVGKLLLGLYMGKASVGSAYGAAGSLVAVIVWVYYSAQIFFFGAEFTRVRADARAPASAPAPAREERTLAAPHSAMAAAHSSEGRPMPQPSTRATEPDFGRTVPTTRAVAHGMGQKSRASLLVAAAIGFLLLGARAAKHGESQCHTPGAPR